ncbi:hypothetical protein QA596_12815, partial [Balneolales bacterium ANBcel1]|nr:hypothetical protein [Balneolales bacterium ANBcel1]
MTYISSYAQFTDGDGSEANPYQVATLEQLQAIGEQENLDKHFIQTADIDASETADWNDGEGFEPIGSRQDDPFTGVYDGQGYVITNLTIHREEEDNVGLFGVTGGDTAVIQNVHLEQASIHGKNYVGAIAGNTEGAILTGSGASGSVAGEHGVGGLIGEGWCEVDSSYAHVDVSGDEFVGGLVGGSQYWMISESFATGNVNGNRYVGGLSAFNGYMIESSYASGEVTGESYVGGLTGYNASSVTGQPAVIRQSFATGLVTGNEDTGGLYGRTAGSVYGGYWDIDTSGKSSFKEGLDEALWGPIVDESKGLTTDQMTGPDAFIHMYKLDFDNIWQLTEGYPVLKWQDPDNAVDQPQVSIIRVDTAKHDFGQVSTDRSGTGEVAIRNTGNTLLSGEVYLAGSDSGLFAIDDELSTFSLEAGSRQDVAIAFQPESAQSYEAEMHIVHDAPNRSDTLIVPLVGEGKEPTFAMPDSDRPQKVALYQNYPNPFNPVTVIRYDLLEGRQVSLVVYDVMGRRVAT